MNKLELLKDATELVVSIGVSSIVGNTLKLVKDPEAKFYKRFAVGVGSIVLSAMISDKAGEYASGRIDKTAETFNKLMHPVPVITDLDENEMEEEV